jgi:thiopeptide-type bacteriocin biosynthesis protein
MQGPWSDPPRQRQFRRRSAALTWRAYAIRSRARATPHGIFAGIAPAMLSGDQHLRLGTVHRTRTVPDAQWLNQLAHSILGVLGVLPEVTLTTSNLSVARGERREIESAARGSQRSVTASVRNNEVTTFVLEACSHGMPAARILDEIATRWPHAAPGAGERLLRELIDRGYLLHDLLPDDPRLDPFRHLLNRIPTGFPHRRCLEQLRELLACADLYPPGDPKRLALLTEALSAGTGILPAGFLLRVDTVADATVSTPAEVARKAAEAAGVLWRIGWGTDPLTGYHQRFITRYGTARAVPLLDVLDPVTGLGPADDAATPIGTGPPDSRREEILTRLVSDAIARDATEITLDEATVDRLANRSHALAPRSAEIYVRVLAADGDRQRLVLAVCGGSQDALSTTGRFVHLLPGPQQIDEDDEGALVAEVVSRPRTDAALSVAAETGLAACRIPVGVPPRRGDLDLADLTVFSEGRRLLVWSRSRDRRVRPVLYSRVALSLLPPAARFLALAGHAGERPWHCWSWTGVTAPFTPAVRYRGTWLAAARWVLPQHLTSAAATAVRWEVALAGWLASVRPRIPGIVATDDEDRQLPLDLRRADDRELLRRYVRRGLTAVTGPPGWEQGTAAVLPGPDGRHVLELVVCLDRAGPAPGPVLAAPPVRRPADKGLHLPGGPWLSLAVQAPAACHEQILLTLARHAGQTAEGWDRWFWLRYTDTRHGEHLRIRFHADPADIYGTILPGMTRWAAGLRRQRLSSGFCIEPYEQETERYGGTAAITTAERFFDADSRLALDILSKTREEDARLAVAAAAATVISRRVGTGAILGGHLDRAGHRRADALRMTVRGAQDHQFPPEWTSALDGLASVLPGGRADRIASDLIHLHCNRLVPAREDLVRTLAADMLAHHPEGV